MKLGLKAGGLTARVLTGVLGVGTIALAAGYIFHLWMMMFEALLYSLLALAIPLFFVNKRVTSKESAFIPWYDLLLGLAGFGIALSFALNAEAIVFQGWERGAPTPLMLAGFVLMLILLEGTRRGFGWWIFGIAAFFLFEPLFSHVLPGPLQGASFPFARVMSYHAFGYESLLGPVSTAGAKLLIGFLLFAGMLQASGGGRLILDMAMSVLGRYRGGPAKVSAVAGAIFGMFSPSSIATVLTNGPFTIPAMKKAGYPAEYAAAVETCASTGGAFVPPVMGASAFIMASMLNVPYWTIVVAAITPSILYYLILFVQADSYAGRTGIKGAARADLPSFRAILAKVWPFLLPLLLLIWFLARGVEAQAPFYSAAALLVCSFILKDTRPTLGGLWKSLESSFVSIAELMVLLYTIGALVGALSLTGVAITLGYSLAALVGGAVVLLPLVAMVAGYVLGTGLPVVAVYIVLAVSLAPGLVKAGYPLIPVHIFCLFIGELSMLTPPVATPAIMASQIAGIPKSMMKVGWLACRLGLGLFVLPLIWIFNPALLLGQAPALDSVISLAMALIGFTLVSGAFERYLVRLEFNRWQSFFIGVAGFAIALLPIWFF